MSTIRPPVAGLAPTLGHGLTLAMIHGAGEGAEKAGVVIVALLATVAVLGIRGRGSERARAWAMLGALVLTPVLLVIEIWNISQLRHLRERHPALAVAAVIAGVIVVGALTALFARRPGALPIAAIVTLPFRLPISSDGTTSNLLIPLYLVVAAGALAYLLPRLLSRPGAANAPPDHPAGGRPPSRGSRGVGPWWRRLRRGDLLGRDTASTVALLELLLMGSVVLYTLQATYSDDFTKALENTVFFYVPFALLYRQMREVRWTRQLIVACFAVLVVLALALSGVGFVEYARKQLFLNPQVIAANQFGNYFRVNSLFFDPNIYGRFLAIVMIVVATTVMWSARRRDILIGGLVLAWLWAGLVTSFSQSSIAALLLGLAVLAAWRWDARSTIYVTVALVAIAGVAYVAAPASLHFGLNGDGGSTNNATDGRTNLVTGGLSLFADRPIEGFGSGSFAREYVAHGKAASVSSTTDSHTIPVTIAAEQGLLGLALYVALVVVALIVLFGAAGRSPPRIAIAACFAALILHTLVYADFLEDPITWVLLGIGVALALAAPAGEAPALDRDGAVPEATESAAATG